VAPDGVGNVYFTRQFNFVFKLGSRGILTVICGGPVYSGDGGPGSIQIKIGSASSQEGVTIEVAGH
jgi:hypothetical protein